MPNTKVKFYERYTNPITGKPQKVSVTMDKDTRGTRKQAQAILDKKIEEKLALLSTSCDKELTLSKLTELYIADQQKTKRNNTWKRNKNSCSTFCRLLGENSLCSRLSAGYVTDRFMDNNTKEVTYNERVTRFKALIRWGYKKEYIEDISYLDRIENLPDKRKKIELHDKYLDSGELTLLLKNMEVKKWKLLTQFMALSGLRIGEAIALYISDVDFELNQIHVTKTYDYIDCVITPPKTEESNRDVYMQPELKEVCIEILNFINSEHYENNKSLFMCDENGDYINYYSFNKYLRELGERLFKKAVKTTTHILRHTHVALMAEAGIPLDVISRRIGHSDEKTTRDIYFHVTKKLKAHDDLLFEGVSVFK